MKKLKIWMKLTRLKVYGKMDKIENMSRVVKKKIEKLKKLYTWKGLKKWTKLLKLKKLEKCRTEKDLSNQRICRNWKQKRIEKIVKKKKRKCGIFDLL